MKSFRRTKEGKKLRRAKKKKRQRNLNNKNGQQREIDPHILIHSKCSGVTIH